MQFLGVYIWSKELDNQSTTRVKSLPLIGWIIVIVLSAGLTALFFYEIPAFSRLLTSEYAFDTKLASTYLRCMYKCSKCHRTIPVDLLLLGTIYSLVIGEYSRNNYV